MTDFAPGLPKKTDAGDISQLKAGKFVDFIVQRHDAQRAGTHFDVRLGTPQTGLFSWATKKELPKPGERRALFQQPLHRHEYKNFEGEIPEGYGKGKVTKHEEGQLLITKITPSSIQFTKTHKKFPERFVLVKPKEEGSKQWLLINTTPTDPIPYKKIHYSKISPDKAEAVLANLQPGSSVQAKIDGAASLTKLMADKLDVVSYRASKTTGAPILHTERLFKGEPVTVKIPSKYIGSVLRGELYGKTDKGVIPPQELGGILNSTISKSVTTQKERGIDLKNMIFDIQQLGEKPLKDVPYEHRLRLVQQLLKHLPGNFEGPTEAKTPEEAVKLFRQIREGRHPLTKEGIVIHRPHKKPVKVKFTEEHDVHITGVFPGKGRLAGQGAGGFTYSFTPRGKTVGKVGTGFSEEARRDMLANPSEWIGRVAKIRAQEKLPSGALRAPSLLALHEDYPTAKVAFAMAAISALDYAEALGG